MNAKRSGSYGGSWSAWLTDYRIVGFLNQKVRKIIDTTTCLRRLPVFAIENHFPDHQNRAHRDGGIRDVKGWPV